MILISAKLKRPAFNYTSLVIITNLAVQRPESDFSCLAEARPVHGRCGEKPQEWKEGGLRGREEKR